jgi:hypothetical protein
MKRKILLCLALSLFLSCAYAVKVSPVRFDISVARGSSQEFTLKVFGSKGAKNQDLVLYPSDLSMNRGGAFSFDSVPGKNSAVQFIEIEQKNLLLLEDQAKEIKFKVSVPFNAQPGEYYAVILVEPSKYTIVDDKSRKLKFLMMVRPAVVVILEVPGRTYEKKGEALDLQVLKTDSLIGIKAAFKNTSFIHLDVSGDAVVRSVDGKINYGTFSLNALSSPTKKAFIFPGNTRDFVGALDRQLPTGDYTVEASFNFGYEFKKKRVIQKFSVVRKKPLDISKSECLRLKSSNLDLFIPDGGRLTKIITLTNIDYQPLNIKISSSDWVKILPDSLSLKPGEIRNIMATVSVAKYDVSQKKETLVYFKPDRGKGAELKVFATCSKDLVKTIKK